MFEMGLMNDTYFFGKRMNLNQGGRVNFNQGGPGFYNQADQELYARGLQYLPQEQYRLSYNAPIIEEEE